MGVRLTPVSGDPFAQPAAKSPGVKLTPVNDNPFAPQPGILDRIGSALSNAYHAVANTVENSPAETIVRKNRAEGRPQPDAFGSVAAAVPTAEGVNDLITGNGAAGSFRRSAGRGVIPSLAGAGGFGAGAAAGGVLTAPAEAIPVAGPVVNGLGALIGGLLGAYGASSVTGKVQDTAINAMPGNVQRALGQDPATRQADELQHPIAAFSGGLAPALLTMRPGFSPTPVAEDAPILTRLLSKPATGAVVGGSLGGAQEAARETVDGEGLDPTKIAIATGTGAVLNRPTALGSRLFEAGGNASILGMQRAARGAGLAREALTGRSDQAARQPFDVEAAATEMAPEGAPRLEPPVKLTPVKGDPFTASPEPATVAPSPPAEAQPVIGAAAAEGGEAGTAGGSAALPAPSTLSGDALIRYIVATDGHGRSGGDYEKGIRADIGDATATLKPVPLSDFEDSHVDPESISDDGSSELPPIVVHKGSIYEGNHRVAIARARGDTHINAYVVGDAKAKGEPIALPVVAQASEPQPLQDDEQYVRTPAGNKVRTRAEVVDASTLTKAEGNLQNRDRTRDTTALQVQDIISKFDPELLGSDPSSDRGAPIAHQDNTVLSGNGRMLALNEIYANHPEKADAYRQFIESQGHSTEGIERPVLIRRVTQDMTPEEARQFVVESNKDNKLELSPVERARSDADTVTPEMLTRYAGGDLNSGANAGFVEAFTKRLTAGELGNVIGSDRRLTTTGIERIENAVVAKAYDHPKLLEKLMESAHNEIRAVTSSLANVAPAWASMRAAAKAGEIDGRYDITHDLADAAMRVAQARRTGEKPADILSQQDAFDRLSPATEALIRAFYNPEMTRAASVKAVTSTLRDYVEQANAQKATEGLFGAEPGKEPADIINDLLRQRDNPNGGETLFDVLDKENGHDTSGTLEGAEGQGEGEPGEAPRQGGREESSPGGSAGEDRPEGGSGGSRADHGDQALDVTDEHKPTERGGYQPSFAEASFTDRQSVYSSAVDALGMDRDKFNLLPPQRKAKLLGDALTKLTGIKVTVAKDMLLQHAVDQMLDAHQTLQGMADVLGIAPRGLSLGGKLSLRLQGKGKFLGSYTPGFSGELAALAPGMAGAHITLPKRSNSFAHEWGHALDYHLLGLAGAEGRGLSGAIRSDGSSEAELPPGLKGAFVNLLNRMFFDQAQAAERIMQLEKKIAATKSAKQKALLTAQLDRLKEGSSKARGIDSAYYAGAKKFEGGGEEYWTRPTEMFARAFEAWVGFKVANAGFGSEFIGKGNDNYLSDVEDRFKLTFPKGEERAAIFEAFQQVVDAMNAEQAIGGTAEAVSGFNDTATPAMKQEATASRNRTKRSLNPFAADFEAVETWFHNRKVDQEEDSRRAADPVKLLSKVNNARAIAFSAAADGVKMVAKRWGSATALAVHDHFANDLGGTRATRRGWTDAVELATNKALNPVFGELERIAGRGWVFKKLTREQKDVLAKLATGKEVADDMGLSRLASIMRKTFNDAWYMQRNAGIDLGYIADAGYLNRQVDRELVAGNTDKFAGQAAKVYEILFDRDVGDSPEAIAADPERIASFIDIAKSLGVAGFKELRKAIKEDSEEDPLPIIEGMFDDVRSGFAVMRAHAYLDSILHQETFADHTAAASLSQSEKPRALPAEADELLRDFYNPDPVSSLVHYVHNAIRRSEWNSRFGRPAGAKKDSPAVAKQLDDRMAREGVPASDRRFVWDLVDRMSGRYQRKGWLGNPAVAGSLAALRVKGTLALMGRAVTLSFFEPASLGIVTGRPLDGAMAVAKTWAAILHKGSRQEMAEWARAHGFMKHHLLEQMMSMDRFGTTSDTPSRLDRLPAAMFRNTGLTFLTQMSEAAVVDVGRRAVLNDMAHRVINGGRRGKDAAALMAELGIRDPYAFSKQIVDMGNALPSDDWMNTAEGFDYATALQRLSRYTIQKPAPAELAPLGRNPLMSYASYSITAFIQSSYRNLFKRNVIKGFRLLHEHEWTTLGLYTLGTLASVGVLYALQLLGSIGREYAFNPERQRQWERDGTWWQNNAGLAAQRTFSFAWGDSLMNAATGLRYNRDLAYLPLGAYAGNDFQNLGKVVKAVPLPKTQSPFLEPPSQSRKTNTAEYNALAGAYNFAIGPALSAGISAAPGGGPISTVLSGASQSTLTGPIAAEKFARSIVGPKDGSVQADGTKAKGGPTKYDDMLNSVFGEPKKKVRAE
jgi:hypothetical protein